MSTVETPTTCCRFGIARGDVTSPVGIYHRMWGAATHERATGVHRPLTATAVVLEPLQDSSLPLQTQVIVAVDLCLLWAKEMETLLTRVATSTGYAQSQIAVAFSHTHAAGLMGLERAHLPGGELIAPYLEGLAQTIAALVEEARATLQPSNMAYGYGRCKLAGQRDLWDAATNQFVCGFNPNAEADDSVLVARVHAEDGTILATLVNYACHPTTLAWQNTLISPDFLGAMRAVIERATGAPCVFLQGASGDLGPRDGFVGDVGVADRNGRELGYAVLSTLEGMAPPATRFVYTGPVISGATIGTWAHQSLSADALAGKKTWDWERFTVDLPYRTDLPGREQTLAEIQTWQKKKDEAERAGDIHAMRDAHAMVERHQRRLTRIQYLPPGPDFPMPVTLGRLGDALWCFVEGELYQWFQIELRRAFPGVPIMVTTLTNGSRCCYLPSADAYGKGIYQESIAVLDKGCLEQLLAEVMKMIRLRLIEERRA